MQVVIFEEIPLIRESAAKICAEIGFTVIASTGSFPDAESACQTLRPEIVVMDLALDHMLGFRLLGRVKSLSKSPKILALAAKVNEYTVYLTDKMALDGFLDKKTMALASFRQALTSLAEGRRWFSPAFHSERSRLQSSGLAFYKILSEREITYLQRVAQGLSDREIAEVLGISVRTGEGHRSHLLKKLNIENTPKLVAYAKDKGLDFSI